MNGVPDLLLSSTGVYMLPRAPHQPTRYAAATYYVFTSTGKIASSLCEHRHAKETQAILCAQRLAKSIGGVRGQVCIKCQVVFDGSRADAAAARWEPYSHDSTEDVAYGPLICPGCVARLLDTTLTQLAATRGTLSLAPGLVRMTVTDGDPLANQQRIQFNGIGFEVGEILRFGAEVRTTSTAAAIISLAFDRGANGTTYRRYGSRAEPGKPFTYIEVIAEVPQGTQAVLAWVSLQPDPGKTVGDLIEVRKVTTCGLPYIDSATANDPDAGLYYETVAGVTIEMTPDPDGDRAAQAVPIGEAKMDLTGAYVVPAPIVPKAKPALPAPSTLLPSPPTLSPEYVASPHRIGWGSQRTGRVYSHGSPILAYSADLGTQLTTTPLPLEEDVR